MKNGGMYDQLGGGFPRYSTDERWLVPHFEKMLYDNARSRACIPEAFQVNGLGREYARVAEETLDYVLREMPGAGGWLTICSHRRGQRGRGGAFCVPPRRRCIKRWEPRLAQLFCTDYGVTPTGNFEDGQSVLHTPRPFEQVAAHVGLAVDDARTLLEVARQRMHDVRRARVPPQLDDKVLTSWNGLMIGAMADGARILGHERHWQSAERAARFVLSHLERPDGGLYRVARAGQVQLEAYLEDYAVLADGLISLYEASGAQQAPRIRRTICLRREPWSNV